MKGDHLGEFEELVLLTVGVLHREAYGVAVKIALEKHTGRRAKISSVHAALHRLENKGFVSSWVGGATNERGGRRKRYFEITGAGKAALAERRTLRERLWRLRTDLSLQRNPS